MSDLDELTALHRSCGCSHLGGRCAKDGCALILPPVAAVCIDCDRCLAFTERAKRPDLIVLLLGTPETPSRWPVVEMKSRAADGHEIVRQLQAGVDAIATHPSVALTTSSIGVQALVVHEKGLKTAARDVVGRSRIRFRRDRFPIGTARCGSSIR